MCCNVIAAWPKTDGCCLPSEASMWILPAFAVCRGRLMSGTSGASVRGGVEIGGRPAGGAGRPGIIASPGRGTIGGVAGFRGGIETVGTASSCFGRCGNSIDCVSGVVIVTGGIAGPFGGPIRSMASTKRRSSIGSSETGSGFGSLSSGSSTRQSPRSQIDQRLLIGPGRIDIKRNKVGFFGEAGHRIAPRVAEHVRSARSLLPLANRIGQLLHGSLAVQPQSDELVVADGPGDSESGTDVGEGSVLAFFLASQSKNESSTL